MSESSQPSERLPKDSIRIVYHAENRTFARLFNERTLEQVKDVVRRKLGLGRETDISLKQMGPDALLDLEDDDDFQAFRVLLRTSVSADIRVTVGRSQGPPVPPPVAPQSREQPSVTKPPVTSSSLPSKQPAGSAAAAAGQSSTRPEVASTTTEPSTATKKTPDPSARKRKVSFGDAAAMTPDKPAERRVQSKPVAVTPVSSAKTAETPAAPKPVAAEEPPKKKQKKEIVKAKDVQPTEGVESPSTKASSAPKPKVKKSTALDRGGEAGTSAPKDGEASEPPAKKPRKQKKDDSTVLDKSSAPANPDGMDQPISQPSDLVNDTSLQPASKRPVRKGVSKTRQSEKKIGVCATIPRTSASTNVQSEVAAAILSGCLSKASEIIAPTPPAKRKSVKKDTKTSSASSSALLAKSTTVSHAPANGVPNVPTEHRLEHVVPTNEPPPQTRELNGPPCPICLEEPFHIRYRCPTVLKGPDAIRERLEEVKRTNWGDQQSLIKELEGLLRDSEVTSEPSLNAAPPHNVQSREASQPFNASASRTPNIPSNSNLSEVTVESRDEGSSSESSDDMSEERIELPAPGKQKTPDKQPDDLEAVIRGPALKRQSILHVIDRIVEDEADKNSDSEEVQDELEEEDPDEEIDRSRRRLSKHFMRSSDSESEEDESKSPSPSPLRPDKDNMESGVQGSNNPVDESIEHEDDDVVMRDCVDPPVRGGQDDDSSEKTHVGSEDRMVVDNPIGEKDATAIVEEQPSSPAPRASVLQPLDDPSNEPQESGQTDVDPASNQDGDAPVASKIPNEAEVDPIEPADDLEPPTISRSSNADPIEAPPEDIGSVTQSTPNPGVTKRIKTRNGQILDEAERPVLVEQLTSETTEEITPLPTKGKSRRKIAEMSTDQEPTSTRRSPRFSSLPPSTSTPVAVALLNHRAKVGARSGKAAKTPAKRSEQRTDASQSNAKDDNAQNGVRIAPTQSLIAWETLAEPSSSPSLHLDELMSSSPQSDDDPIHGRLNVKDKKSQHRKPALSSEAKSSQGKERLFDPSSSQIAFPYSQHKNNPAPMAFPNGKEREVITDSEEEAAVTKKRPKLPLQYRYRSLSQLATQATLFSPSLPTPANKSVTNGKTKKRVADKDSSSSSSSSDEDEANGSEHIPRGRRAGSVLETKKTRRSLLSRT